MEQFHRSPQGFSETPRLVPRGAEAEIPLTFQQQWLWYVLTPKFSPEDFNVKSTLHLLGPLDPSALDAAVAAVTLRHEALRTAIVEVDGTALQSVQPESTVPIKIIPVLGETIEARQNEARKLIANFVKERPDYRHGPLFKVQLLRLAETDHVLTLLLDHMISDGLSITLLWRDIQTAYLLALAGRAIVWSEETAQYPDYAIWQNEPNGLWGKTNRGYWDEKLKGAAPIRFRPDSNTRSTPVSFASTQILMEEDLCMALRRLATTEGTTLPLIFLTAFVALVSLRCEQRTFVVPLNSMGRNDPAIANAIGYFAHIIHLRMELSENDTYRDILDRAKNEYVQSLKHDDLGRTVREQPQFIKGAWFQCENMSLTDTDLQPWGPLKINRFELMDVPTSTPIQTEPVSDTSFIFMEQGRRAKIWVSFRSDRFKSLTARAVAGDLISICQEFAIAPWSKPTQPPNQRVGNL